MLLLAVSTLVLCQRVASYPICLESITCQMISQDLLNNVTYLTARMHYYSSEMLLELVSFSLSVSLQNEAPVILLYYHNYEELVNQMSNNKN